MWRHDAFLVLLLAFAWIEKPQFCHGQALRSVVETEAIDDTARASERNLLNFGKNKEGGNAANLKVEKSAVVKDGKDKKKNKKIGKKVEDDEPIIEDGYFEGDEVDVFAEGEDDPPDHILMKEQARANIAGDKRTIDNVSIAFQEAKARLLERLKKEYGDDVYENIWMDEPAIPTPNNATKCTIGRNAFLTGMKKASTSKSWYRTVRKMKINLLQYLVSGDVQDFVWATAGSSDAAGHGNFLGQQYTMVMWDRAKELFQSVGLDLIARPFGMGAATSAPEIAGCVKEIYGTDVDIITWDFAMTDARWYWRLEFFAHRVAMLPNHPALLMLHSGTEPKRKEMAEHLTFNGLSVLRQDEKYIIDRQLSFPDSRFKSEKELKAMPESVRHFRCGYGIEMGEGCYEHKFTKNGTCDDRSFQTNWHHGWKWHAFYGNLYALFLMEIMQDALHEISQEQGDLGALLDKLVLEEISNFNAFEADATIKYRSQWSVSEVDALQLMRDQTYCRTALLPAQTRYHGTVFNLEKNYDWFSYKKGIVRRFANDQIKKAMVLSYFPKDKRDKCEVPTYIDSKDFFLAAHAFHGYQRVVIPNDAEIKAFGKVTTSGVIMVCAQSCSFECHGTPLLSPDSIDRGNKSKFRVNGEDVATVKRMDNCFILEREDGSYSWPADQNGKYSIEVHTLAKNKEFRFTSFIIW